MKFIKSLIALMAVAFLLPSCLKSGLEDLPAFDESKITAVNAEFRYPGPTIVFGEPVIEIKTMDKSSNVIDPDKLTAVVAFKVPAASGTFTEAVRSTVDIKKLAVYFSISIASRVTPLKGAPALGVPADWSGSPYQYELMAANGTKSIWTVTVTLQ